MKSTSVCHKCKSRRIMPELPIYCSTIAVPGLKIKVFEQPEAILFKHDHIGQIAAWVCGDCGYTEFYTSNAGDLYSVWEKNQAEGHRA
jgi:predicted nucleic-acid-binding Zn-ribbon protein